ncbi:GGDEF domain-containing protein [Actinoplanes couchii]|uniref:GGDEF domain-containing protein n=1 Tax=Actinoplanes couchii TaxID=403638 RepID=A0ABQ3XDC9_9ACTN|nr:GGDEF domain-containing protein [Actinoplanes couchii]MDR6321382.1 hypothetical protein [Actinoplanes couchii]GID56492.1 hypothetical protein Aco03nite_048960 [Actinoplanes couchii]
MLKHSLPRALVSRGLGIVSTMLATAGITARREPQRLVESAPLPEVMPVYAGRRMAVLLLELDRATTGDLIDNRLTGALDREGRAERLGAARFRVLLPDADATEAARVLNRIRFTVRQPAVVGGGTVRIGLDAGVAVRPAGSDTPLDVLTTEADTDLRRAHA